MKRLFWLTMLMLPLLAAGQKSSLTLTVPSGLEPGALLVVSEPQGGRLVPVDTLVLDSKRSVRVERRSAEPLFFTLSPLQSRALLHCMLLPKEKVSLTATCRTEGRQLLLTAVKGSDNMELYRQFNELMADGADPSTPDRVETLLRSHKELLMSAFLVTYFETAFEQYAPLYKEIRDALIGRYAQNEFVQHIDQKVRTVVMAGMEAPEIALSDTAGHTRRLSDLRGQVVLIDFWASWCGPCRKENPNVVRLYRRYHDLGFEIFSVSLDKDYDKWVKAIKDDHLEWPNHVSDLQYWNSAAGRLYGINSIPATVLLDRDGKVLARNLRGQQLENKLKEIFGQ